MNKKCISQIKTLACLYIGYWCDCEFHYCRVESCSSKSFPEFSVVLKFWCISKLVQFSSVAQSRPTLCDPMNRSMPGLPVHHQLPEFTQTHVHQVSDAIQPSHPGSSPFPPAPNPSQHQSLFQWINFLHEVAKVLEFQLSIIPSKEHPGLIPFRMEWLDLLAVQGTLKSLLQHLISKAWY